MLGTPQNHEPGLPSLTVNNQPLWVKSNGKDKGNLEYGKCGTHKHTKNTRSVSF